MVAKKLLEVFRLLTELPESEQNLFAEKMLKHIEQIEQSRDSSCRNEILACINGLIQQTGIQTFRIDDVIRGMHNRGSKFAESTIRTHVSSVMCSNAPQNHVIKYHDLERVGRG